ncbi:MAG: Flp pilus assembly protein CpaB [Hyphomicrobiaceae bacterium]|nr:Flp pilus assembly protein CpaB [Hyphomicrobiaceae bacterium]
MRFSNLLMLGGAAVCALIATVLTASLFRGERPKPVPVAAPVAAPAPEVRKIVVAARPLSFGAALTPDALKEIPWPNEASLPGTFANAAALALEKRSALSAIGESEPVLLSRVSAPGQSATLSALIEGGLTAITIRVDEVVGVAGLVQPGDRVNVLLTQNRGAAAGSAGEAFSDTLLQNVRVLAIDQTIDTARAAKPAKAVTVEVNAEQAQKLALAASVGQLSLALRGTASRDHAETRRIGLPDLSRPEGPAGTQAPSIAVTRGTDRTIYEVLVDGRTGAQRLADAKRVAGDGGARPGHEANGKPTPETPEAASPQ